MTVAECAAELGVSSDSIIRWIEGGHLAAFVPPGRSIGTGLRGPKGYLIFREDWHGFCRARTMTGQPSAVRTGQVQAAKPVRSIGVPAAGTDGVRRRGQQRSS